MRSLKTKELPYPRACFTTHNMRWNSHLDPNSWELESCNSPKEGLSSRGNNSAFF